MEIKIKPEWNGGNSCPSQRYGKKTTATKLYTHILYLNNVTFVQTEEDYTLIVCEQCNNTFDERK